MLAPERQRVLPVDPFDPDARVGVVSEIDPASVLVELDEHAVRRGGRGDVGGFVVLECDDVALLGRLTRVERAQRVALANGGKSLRGTIGAVQLLTTVRLGTGRVSAGIETYPKLGAAVFAAHPEVVQWLAEAKFAQQDDAVVLDVATLDDGTPVRLMPEKLFGRHCAVLGTTGGGKSWTIARMIESAMQHQAKLILLDPTGEYYPFNGGARHISLGGPDRPAHAEEVTFPYRALVEDDLIALFRPDSRVQLAKMRAAIKSLKLAELVGFSSQLVAGNGCIPKTQQPKAPFDAAYHEHVAEIETPKANFAVELLPTQIRMECVWPTAGLTPAERARWGDPRVDELSECDTLMARIEQHLAAREYACLFEDRGASFPDQLEQFLASDDRVLRVSLRDLAFTGSTREIVVNAIGRFLLELGRDGRFVDCPIVVLIDEAHQFVNRSLGEPWWSHSLDAFELIAKEGRKYALTVCLATQRPRDIPEGILSQMGTFVVHRLVDDADREIVERASGEVDREAAKFLPTLGPGQAVLIGADLPMPFTVQFRPPTAPPDSSGPDYQVHWR